MLNLQNVKVGKRQRWHLHNKLLLINRKLGFIGALQICLCSPLAATSSGLYLWITAHQQVPVPPPAAAHRPSTPSTPWPDWLPQTETVHCHLSNSLGGIPAAFRWELELECPSGPKRDLILSHDFVLRGTLLVHTWYKRAKGFINHSISMMWLKCYILIYVMSILWAQLNVSIIFHSTYPSTKDQLSAGNRVQVKPLFLKDSS